MGVQKHYKNLLQKNRVEECLQKNRQKNPNRYFSIFLITCLGVSRFSVRGVKRHDKQIGENPDQPWYFFGLRGTNQPRQGPSVFFECPVPLGCGDRGAWRVGRGARGLGKGGRKKKEVT
jgi:hypothetical protein